jgi:hypothetical protein
LLEVTGVEPAERSLGDQHRNRTTPSDLTAARSNVGCHIFACFFELLHNTQILEKAPEKSKGSVNQNKHSGVITSPSSDVNERHKEDFEQLLKDAIGSVVVFDNQQTATRK